MANKLRSWSLYWCRTADAGEDWFVVATSKREACRFHEVSEGYDRGDADARRVTRVPVEVVHKELLSNGINIAGIQSFEFAFWPSDVLLAECGGVVLPLAQTGNRAQQDLKIEAGIVMKAVKFGDEVYVAGDLVDVALRALSNKANH